MSFIRGVFNPDSARHHLLRTIRSLGFLNMTHGPWVAGGAVRRIINAETDEHGDIDLFCDMDHPDQLKRVVAALHYRGDCNRLNVRDDALYCAFRVKSDTQVHDIQVIKDRSFTSVEALLLDFDFTVCMAATDGWSWVIDERFLRDTAARELVLNKPPRGPRGLRRLEKYCAYGFTPTPAVTEVFMGLADDSLATSLTHSGYLKQDNAYY